MGILEITFTQLGCFQRHILMKYDVIIVDRACGIYRTLNLADELNKGSYKINS